MKLPCFHRGAHRSSANLHNDSPKRSHTAAGFTLIEAAVTVTIVALVTVALVKRIDTSHSRQKGVAIAKRLVTHIRYAQEMAVLRGKQTEFRLFPSSNSYECRWVGGGLLKDPLNGTQLEVHLGRGRTDDMTITSTGLPGGTVRFDYLGIPIANGSPLGSKTMVVTLNNKYSVWIEPYSGKVYVDKSFGDD